MRVGYQNSARCVEKSIMGLLSPQLSPTSKSDVGKIHCLQITNGSLRLLPQAEACQEEAFSVGALRF